MTKICSTCRQDKPYAEFHKKSKSQDGLQRHCRDCSHKKFAKYYKKNKAHHLSVVKENKRERRKTLRSQLMDYLSSHPCVDCGEKDPIVLEFDHINGVKRSAVTKMVQTGCSWEQTLLEIKKCVVRCCNCHRRVTYQRLNSYRITPL